MTNYFFEIFALLSCEYKSGFLNNICSFCIFPLHFLLDFLILKIKVREFQKQNLSSSNIVFIYIPCLEFLNKSRIMTCHIFFKVGQCVLTLSIDIQILSTGSPPPTHKKILFSNLLIYIYISFDHYLQFSISQIHSRALSYKNRTNFFF